MGNTTSNTRTIKVEGLRVIPSDNPSVKAVAKFVLNGKPKSKAITAAMVAAGARVNLSANTLTLPIGKRGRRPSVGLSQSEIDSLLG